MTSPIVSRLPTAYGNAACDIHTAELMGMIAGLRYAQPGNWNLYVGDRSSLFSLLRSLSDAHTPQGVLRSANIPLATRVQTTLQRLKKSWVSPPTALPSWRLHQITFPDQWNVQKLEAERHVWYSQIEIAFCEFGLVGVDVRSHQVGAKVPMPIIVQGNEAQDRLCGTALQQPHPVLLPSGGTFAFLSIQRTMVTSPARAAVRALLRQQALSEWQRRPVQGKLASLQQRVFTASLDPHFYTSCSTLPASSILRLAHDPHTVDLSATIFRCVRLIGGGWTEQLKVQPEYARVAQFLYERNLLDTPRTCPLCRLSPGTPRHTTMDCPVTKPLADALRSILEQHLQKLDERGTISSAARAWQRSLSQQGQAHLL